MRLMIAKAAKAHKFSYYIPCYDGVPCETWAPPQIREPHHKNYSVFAGHLYWPAVEKGVYLQEYTRAGMDSKINFDCLTVFREPISRVVSCWNYRFRQSARYAGAEWSLSSMNISEIDAHLTNAMSLYGEGCNNEPLRIFSDSGRSEEKINTMTSERGSPSPPPEALTKTSDFLHDKNGWAIDSAGTLYHTLDHMQHCVVGVFERCEETKIVIDFFFPWLSYQCVVHANKGAVAAEPLSAAQAAEISRQNALEVLAYKAANVMLDAQLDVVRNATKIAAQMAEVSLAKRKTQNEFIDAQR